VFEAAMILIALLLVPSLASAHAGHDHRGLAVVAHAPIAADHQPAAPAAFKGALSVSSINYSHSPAPLGCAGECCAGVGCAACCAVALTPVINTEPPYRHFKVGLPQQSLLWVLHPDGLRRPPRLFA
jgi:hypothetical protein